MKLAAGRLRDRVTIQQRVLATGDAYGEQAESWLNVATVLAEVLPLDALESWKAMQLQSEATIQVTMRYTSEMSSDKRLMFGDRYLYPLSVVPDVGKIQLRVLCKERP